MSQRIIIAIDGYSSTGKSSFAREIAQRLGYLHLDSGAVYRAITLYAMRSGLIDDCNRVDEYALLAVLPTLNISLRPDVYLGEENIEERIRLMDVANAVSPVSAIGFIRDFVDSLLRSYGRKGGIVMDGRDIGTKVFPNAQLKIFMIADAEVRAQRRYKELISNGKNVSFDDVMRNISDRDNIDAHRAVSPLRRAENSILLDNTHMTMEDQLVWLADILRSQFSIEI
ncbi:MAG: (d)CMP kinase [Bacteroidales bacterium]|nr:(d)CMP kinase [Bacteroidales bacterium]